jgi:hypothetical protein
LHRRNERSLFEGKNEANWRGSSTWLHVIFNSPLLVFGLGLNSNEVFLRWILIERARYYRKYPDRTRAAWYVDVKGKISPGKHYFLEGVGFKIHEVSSYDEIYGPKIWG